MTRNIIIFVLGAVAVLAQDGGAIYKTRCAGCHDTPTGRVPTFSALRAMSPATIMQSLENGPMKTQAAGLTNGERFALVTFLASPAGASATPPPSSAFCSSKAQTPSTNSRSCGMGGLGRRSREHSLSGRSGSGINPRRCSEAEVEVGVRIGRWGIGTYSARPRRWPSLHRQPNRGYLFTGRAKRLYSVGVQSGRNGPHADGLRKA